jgi:predicted lipoprotein with Yx(FWY)xxD motif
LRRVSVVIVVNKGTGDYTIGVRDDGTSGEWAYPADGEGEKDKL